MISQQKILIVDDKKENLVALRSVLRDLDVEIIEALNGNNALAATLDHSFALAILDVMMPGMNGFELAEHLRSDDTTKLLPVIFVTALQSDEQHLFCGYEAGGVDYIIKPYNPQILLAKVRIFLELDRQRQELQWQRDNLELLVAARTKELEQELAERKRAETEKSILEQQLQQAQKLESLGVLAGGIAHDFNNILAIIIGRCSLAEMNPGQASEHIPTIEKAADRAAGLCRQMLTYAGKAPFSLTKVNMSTLVDEMVQMLKATTNQNVAIKPDLSIDVPAITGDISQLRQIVMNLIINSSEAIGEAQGIIHITLTKTAITARQLISDHLGKTIPPGLYASLEVSDTGCGMDDETKNRIFEPFYTTKFTGRGLGMSAVLGIIAAHKGALQLTSQRGQGTTFRIYLPIETNDPIGDESREQIASMPWQGSGTVLLVDDEDQVKLVAKAMLKALGFNVFDASNGREALDLYQNNAADITLVLTDIGMPVMDGYTLFRELKVLNPELPIIVSSGYGDAEVSARIGSHTIDGLISKPYNIDKLQEILKSVMEGVGA